MGYPSLYKPPKSVSNTGVSTPGPAPPPPPAQHYFPGIGYSTPNLAHLHQYLMANPLRSVPVHDSNTSSSLIYKEMDAVALAAELKKDEFRIRDEYAGRGLNGINDDEYADVNEAALASVVRRQD